MKYLLLFCWVIISSACTNPSSTGTFSPPNFLVIYTDDQRYNALGWAGNDNIIAVTPVFEELYHLTNDPYELNNLVATDVPPASRLMSLRIRLDSLKALYD